MNDLAQLLDLKSKWDYSRGRWHVEVKASSPALPWTHWGGSGSTPEDAVDDLLRNLLRDVCRARSARKLVAS